MVSKAWTCPDRLGAPEATVTNETHSSASGKAPGAQPGTSWPGAGWRADTERKVAEIREVVDWMKAVHHPDRPGAAGLREQINQHLAVACHAAHIPSKHAHFSDLWGDENALVETALGNLDAAETSKLRLTPTAELQGQMPSVEAQVYRYLRKPTHAAHESKISPIRSSNAPWTKIAGNRSSLLITRRGLGGIAKWFGSEASMSFLYARRCAWQRSRS